MRAAIAVEVVFRILARVMDLAEKMREKGIALPRIVEGALDVAERLRRDTNDKPLITTENNES